VCAVGSLFPFSLPFPSFPARFSPSTVSMLFPFAPACMQRNSAEHFLYVTHTHTQRLILWQLTQTCGMCKCESYTKAQLHGEFQQFSAVRPHFPRAVIIRTQLKVAYAPCCQLSCCFSHSFPCCFSSSTRTPSSRTWEMQLDRKSAGWGVRGVGGRNGTTTHICV